MTTLFAIAIFGALGCLTRYYLAGAVYARFGSAFPVGTLAVNVIGAFCIGLVMELSIVTTLIPPTLRMGVAVGFLGGLTTFSTFSYETFRLLEEGELLYATANVFMSVITCLLFTWLGIVAARALQG
jgi:CrcB protein